MRFGSLGSGSRGNATLIAASDQCVLVDCGFTLRQLERRLGPAGVGAGDITAVLVTHEHADHASGVGRLVRRTGVPVYATAGTWRGMRLEPREIDRVIVAEQAFALGDLSVLPVTVPHDAREPVQFRFTHRGRGLGILTDLGHPTAHVVERFRGCDALLLEFNHDPEMLRDGSYPEPLKRRVGGRFGHLANAQSATLLEHLTPERLQVLVGAHLSEKNNTPDHAAVALESVMDGFAARRHLAVQDGFSDWFELC